MKLFKCQNCSQPVYFENTFCISCNASLGFDAQKLDMVSLKNGNNNSLIPYNANDSTLSYKYCINKQQRVCNWLLPAESTQNFCIACNLNHTIPNLSMADSWEKWVRIEIAKHRLVYALLRFNLPVNSKFQDPENGIFFDFLAETNGQYGERLLTGHDNGLITLNIEEADDAVRAMAQKQMDEVYRTLLGHFRHEIGHYYWDRLIKNTDRLEPFRQLFGSEDCDYSEALNKYYNNPKQQNWQNHFISAYATAHPWEDWAETWAHYLHIIDTLETAYSFGMRINPNIADDKNEIATQINIDPYATTNFNDIINRWIPLTFIMNSLNRSMGMKDSYPFVINKEVIKKLNFIHQTIQQQSGSN